MSNHLIDTEKFVNAINTIRDDEIAFCEYVLKVHPKIAIMYKDWLVTEVERKEAEREAEYQRIAEEQRENERKRQEAIENEKRRLAMEQNWAIRVVDTDNKINKNGKKIPIIKLCRNAFGCGLAEAKHWSEMIIDVHTTEQKAIEFETNFNLEFPMLKGVLNIWKYKN